MNAPPARPLAAGATLGILGGGQLGRMLAMAAARLGLRTAIYEPAADCPAAGLASRHFAAAYDDAAALGDFARACDVVTYEFENVPVAAAEAIAALTSVRPGPNALAVSQDRLAEKTFLRDLGIATVPFFAVDSAAALGAALERCGGRGIVKTRRLGYDGKGQVALASAGEADAAWHAIGRAPAILEGFADFAIEVSVVAARHAAGRFAAFDPAWNEHEGGMLRRSRVPAPVSERVSQEATAIARRILDALDYCGVIGVEFFVTGEDRLLVNEIAPRVHNSGHWTEAACLISQFEQHVRAVAGWPLGSTGRHSDCVMENLIGADVDRVPELIGQGDCLVHLYGKAQTRPGRKMGHFTRLMALGTAGWRHR